MNITNKLMLPESLISVLEADTYDYSDNPNAISVGELIDSPKVRILKKQYADQIEQDASESLWLLLGSAIHSVMERAKNPNYVIEKRMEEKIGKWTLRGKPDLFDTKTGEIQDWKVTSVWTVVYGSRKPEWTKQLNIYAWMIRKHGDPVLSLVNNLILRDHSKTEAKRSADYPAIPFVSIKQELWSNEQTERLIAERLKLHGAQENIDDPQELVCSPEEMWTRESKWAIYKEAKLSNPKARAEKICATKEDAEAYIKPLAEKYAIKERPGADARCEDYCPVRAFCSHAKSLKSEKEE